MKKLLALLLALLCVFSLFSVSVSAANVSTSTPPIGGEEEKGPYCIFYKNETLSGVKLMYTPGPSVSFGGPGYVTVTKDTPIAIDHDFVCWKDENGKLYYEGDKVFVNGEVNLYAVWVEKTDNDSKVVRVVKAAVLTFQRMILKILGIFKDIQDFESSYFATEEDESTAPATVAP